MLQRVPCEISVKIRWNFLDISPSKRTVRELSDQQSVELKVIKDGKKEEEKKDEKAEKDGKKEETTDKKGNWTFNGNFYL